MREDAPQREHSLREVFDCLRCIVHTGIQWRMMPNDPPPWHTVYQETQRRLMAGVFAAIVHDLRMPLRGIEGWPPQPSAWPRFRRLLSINGLGTSNRRMVGFARRLCIPGSGAPQL